MRKALATLLITASLASAPTPSLAQQTGAACAAEIDNALRLACYDSVFRGPLNVPDDGELVIESTQTIPARPTGRKPATMVISCKDGELRVSFGFAGQFLSEAGDTAGISFQVQQTGSFVRNLPVSANNTSVGFANSRESDAFLELLEAGNNVVVRITPVRQRSVQTQFKVGDRQTEIAAIRTACAP